LLWVPSTTVQQEFTHGRLMSRLWCWWLSAESSGFRSYACYAGFMV